MRPAHEAAMRLARAEVIRWAVSKLGSTLPMDTQVAWERAAQAELQLAAALTLPPTIFAAEQRVAS